MDQRRTLAIKKSIKIIEGLANEMLSRFGAHTVAIVACCHSHGHSEKIEEIIVGFPDQDHFLVPFLKKALDESETKEPTRII